MDALELSTEDDVADAVLRFADMRKLRFAKDARMSERLAKLVPGGLIPHIGFLWPTFLWLLLLVPLAVGLYLLLLAPAQEDRAALCQSGAGQAGGAASRAGAVMCRPR